MTEAENAMRADIDEFMRRLGPQWFLDQNWFPASAQPENRRPAPVEAVDAEPVAKLIAELTSKWAPAYDPPTQGFDWRKDDLCQRAAASIASLQAENELLKFEISDYKDVIEHANKTSARATAAESLVSDLRKEVERVFNDCAKIADTVASEQYSKAGYKEHTHTYSMIAEGALQVSSRIRARAALNAPTGERTDD